METAEEQNQLKIISPKLYNVKETLEEEEEEEDRISALPDCLILHILSLLPSIEDAIRTGTLSKRWTSLWTVIPTLVLKHFCFERCTSDFISFINKTLTQCRHSKLNKFQISIVCKDNRIEPPINKWIRYATSCKVEHLSIAIVNLSSVPVNRTRLHQKFFINPCFTDLFLGGVMFNPIGAVGWKNLTNLCIVYAYLDEGLIENILSGSPVLKTLTLKSCRGYRRLDITSKSVENLVFSGYNFPHDHKDVIEINAPNILSLKILKELVLWKILLLNVSSLVQANLDYTKEGHWVTTREEGEEEMFKGFTQSFRHVKEIKVGVLCSKVVSRLEAKGFVFPPNMKLGSWL